MVIANPIYDVVFKKMMENDKVAKFFIGTLLDQTIETVEVKPQEFTYTDELAGLAVFRLDFIATIKTDTNEHKKVLIEIQKAKNQIDLMRFRNYLAEQYKKEDIVNQERESHKRFQRKTKANTYPFRIHVQFSIIFFFISSSDRFP